jgi:hypothetical protein
MKILYLVKQDLDATGKKLLELHKQSNGVTLVDIRENKNYDQIVDLIFSNERVISW